MKRTKGRPLLSEKRSRTHCLILYPDCLDHIQLITDLLRNNTRFDSYAMIYHDCDRYTEDDEEGEHKKGELKKPHYHVVLMFPDACTRSACIKKVQVMYSGVKENYFDKVIKPREQAIRYLCHYDDPYKFQYDPSLVVSHNCDITYYLNLKKSCSEGNEIISNIVNYILQNPKITRSQLLDYVISHNWYGEFRQSYSIINDIYKDEVKENNKTALKDLEELKLSVKHEREYIFRKFQELRNKFDDVERSKYVRLIPMDKIDNLDDIFKKEN